MEGEGKVFLQRAGAIERSAPCWTLLGCWRVRDRLDVERLVTSEVVTSLSRLQEPRRVTARIPVAQGSGY